MIERSTAAQRFVLKGLALAAAACAALVLAALLAEGLFRCALFARALAAGNSGDFQLYAAGESSMRGMPFGKAPPDVVSEFFGGELAGRPVRVINLAEGGNSIYPQAIKVVRTLKYRRKGAPAALLVYAGHNEQIGAGMRYPARLRLYEALKVRVLSHSLALSELALRTERYFNFQGVRSQAHYEFYLRSIIQAAKDAGVVPVLTTLASNLAGAEPGGAETSSGLEAAVAMELKGDYPGAGARYRSLLAGLTPQNSLNLRPYLEYRLGRCLQAQGRSAQAGGHLLYALETDPLQFRAKPSQNALLRALAAEYKIPLVDAEALFAGHAPGGLPGSDLFVDMMHPDAPGYLFLSRAYAEKLGALFGDRIRRDIRDPDVFFTPPFSIDRMGMSRTEAYTQAATFLVLLAKGSAPMPDRFKLAEKDFKKALADSAENNLAQVGLRIVEIYRGNGNIIRPEVAAWFEGKRPSFEYLRQLSPEEMRDADAFLKKWERAGR